MNSVGKLVTVLIPDENTQSKLPINADTTVGQICSILFQRPHFVSLVKLGESIDNYGIALDSDQSIVFPKETRVAKLPSVRFTNSPSGSTLKKNLTEFTPIVINY
jgi:hypothetical protein